MRGRAGVAVAALALIGVMALAVLPAQAWLEQRDNREALAAQEAALISENQRLQARVDQLGTNEEIERLARQYNLVKPGEETYFIRPDAAAPAPAPTPPVEPAAAPKRSPSLLDRIASLF